MKTGLIDIIEAAYQPDLDEQAWASRIGAAVEKTAGYGMGATVLQYRLHEQRLEVLSVAPVGVSDEGIQAVMRSHADLPPSHVFDTYASVSCDVATKTGSPETRERTRVIFREHFEPLGWREVLIVNGLDPTGYGFSVGVILPKKMILTPGSRMTWSRVAAHLAAASRLRRRLTAQPSPESADAILTTEGRLEHAAAVAKTAEARARLASGAKAIDRARGPLRKKDPERAVAEWRGLIAARWTLVDHFESDGRRYLLARRNDSRGDGAATLTDRERQALGYADIGHSNKLIAYEMGISPLTVGVLLHRAARKLGAKSRAELLEAYRKIVFTKPR
jgi:DNA-binding CsgD family transcriptional regulator